VDLTEVARRDQVVDMHVPQGSTIELCAKVGDGLTG
jgi:hypothetical protein